MNDVVSLETEKLLFFLILRTFNMPFPRVIKYFYFSSFTWMINFHFIILAMKMFTSDIPYMANITSPFCWLGCSHFSLELVAPRAAIEKVHFPHLKSNPETPVTFSVLSVLHIAFLFLICWKDLLFICITTPSTLGGVCGICHVCQKLSTYSIGMSWFYSYELFRSKCSGLAILN